MKCLLGPAAEIDASKIELPAKRKSDLLNNCLIYRSNTMWD